LSLLFIPRALARGKRKNVILALAINLKNMPYVKVWLHVVWSTKNRKPLLKHPLREEMFNHIYQNAIAKGILMDTVNGHIDHVHCLFRLKNNQTISKVMQLIKGESSFWVNQENKLADNFQWQEEYFAISVSETQVQNVRNYILGQEEHHKKNSYTEEYDAFIKKYGFQVIEGNY